jgi:hypothetical protein
MAMSFSNPVNDAALAKIAEEFGDKIVTHDRKTFLLDKVEFLNQQVMKEIANTAKQPATVELCGEGDIRVMSDGTRYRVTPDGWKKVEGPTST